MRDGTVHALPRYRNVVIEQVRIVGLSLRREALVVAAMFGVLSIVIAINIIRGTAETWFDSDEWFQLAVLAFLYPFAVWRRDRRFAPAFLWTLPVDRQRLALAKVIGGWVWLIVAVGLLIVLQNALAYVSGVANAEATPFIALSGTTAAYLFGSALVLGLRHPVRWILGTAGALFLLGFLNQAADLSAGRIGVFEAMERFEPLNRTAAMWTALSDPARWMIATIVWIGAGVIALTAAISRHREERRR